MDDRMLSSFIQINAMQETRPVLQSLLEAGVLTATGLDDLVPAD